MLVLSRKVGESIVIPGCQLVLTVLEVEGRKMRFGITAPPDVRVYRQELWERTHVGEVIGGLREGATGAQSPKVPVVSDRTA